MRDKDISETVLFIYDLSKILTRHVFVMPVQLALHIAILCSSTLANGSCN